MSEKKLLILNQQQIQQKIDRIAYQILEDNFDEQEILIAGILPRGNHIAERIKTVLDGIAPFTSTLLTIELEKQSSTLQAKINLDVPLKKLRTAVLVDRNHKSFPITTDFTGVALSTVIKEHVDVVLDEPGEEDAVYLR
jgi:pyrimidine operon attenuation protein/uracil phosphoribosyltransferase